MILEDLKAAVVKLLIMEHEMTEDEAEETVNTSASENAHLWHEAAEPKDLANFLASDEGDE